MVGKIKVEDTITDSINHFPKVDDKLQEIRTLMESIEKQLSESRWTGESRDKCRHIQQAIQLYYKEITPLCYELKTHVKKLQRDAADFCGQSDNIKMIQSI